MLWQRPPSMFGCIAKVRQHAALQNLKILTVEKLHQINLREHIFSCPTLFTPSPYNICTCWVWSTSADDTDCIYQLFSDAVLLKSIAETFKTVFEFWFSLSDVMDILEFSSLSWAGILDEQMLSTPSVMQCTSKQLLYTSKCSLEKNYH